MSNQTNTSNNQPRTVQDIIRAIEAKSADGGYIYRGERKCYTKVSSNLYREYDINEEHFDIEVVQKEMLSDAKKHIGDLPQDFRTDFTTFPNVAEEDTDETINFEILTEIQHYGGKTNLIDFTTDYFIALFFACDGHHDKPGRVILQKTDEIQSMIKHPRNPRHRVIAQKSIFVRHPKGFFKPDDLIIINIPTDFKLPLLEHLRKYHGLSTDIIYNDLHGFITNQSIHESAYTEFHRGLSYYIRGDEAENPEEKQEAYEKAVHHYTKALKLKPDLPEGYNNRGNAYREKGEIDKAIQDYNNAIKYEENDALSYNNRGNAHFDKGDIDKANEDYNKAIELDPDFAQAYYNRGNAYTMTGETSKAIEDYNKAIELDPDFTQAYTIRGSVWLHLEEWEKAKLDLTISKRLGVDIITEFHNTYKNVEDFEQTNDVKLPEDIAAMLTSEG